MIIGNYFIWIVFLNINIILSLNQRNHPPNRIPHQKDILQLSQIQKNIDVNNTNYFIKKEVNYNNPGILKSIRNCKILPFKNHTVYRTYHTGIINSITTNSLVKYAFVHIPKAGSSTIRKINNVVFNGEDSSNFVDDDALKIAFVRDPISRFISAFLEIFYRRHIKLEGIDTNTDGIVNNSTVQNIFDEFFDKFINRNISKNSEIEHLLNAHLSSQMMLLSNLDGTGMELDFVGRTETLEHDYNETLVKIYGKYINEYV
jgi:hypothetical protein